MQNAQVKNIMSPSCQWVAPEATIQDAAKMMKDHDIGFLPVGKDDKLIGTITDRDIVLKCVLAGSSPSTAMVKDCMNSKLYYCFDDQSVDEVCESMAEMKVSRFPVVNRAKKLVGVVSYADLSAKASPTVFVDCEQKLKSIPEAKKAA